MEMARAMERRSPRSTPSTSPETSTREGYPREKSGHRQQLVEAGERAEVGEHPANLDLSGEQLLVDLAALLRHRIRKSESKRRRRQADQGLGVRRHAELRPRPRRTVVECHLRRADGGGHRD